MAETKPPMGLDPNMGAREFALEVDAEGLEKMRKVGHVRFPSSTRASPSLVTRERRRVETIPRRRRWPTSAPPSRSDC
jgi:hypothetical protein